MTAIADPMLPQSYRIRRVRRETPDAFTLELEAVNSLDGFSFAAGQFNMLYTFGIGEVPVSISGDPKHPESLVHTVRAVGTVTQAICGLKPGDLLGVRGPFGSHWPVEEARGNDVVIVAGGIGLAHLRPVLYHLFAHRDKYGKIVLLYGARTPQELLYKRDLTRWRGRFDLQVEVTVDAATEDWYGNVGVVTALIPRVDFDSLNTLALICVPEVMMRFVVMGLQEQGITAENIFISMQRNMKCAIGFCGHCQLGPNFVCKDGPVFRYDQIQPFLGKREM